MIAPKNVGAEGTWELAIRSIRGDGPEPEAVPFAEPRQEIDPTVGCHNQQHMTALLRAMYDNLVQQAVPKRLLKLLAKLDQS
ncbi:MAG TPA: NepR family anti-sigma factor [Candidatus Tectomicrobia bacterium]|nr:NepR family anti-sigma factor [Candidatus Tectomicrobia bacterium]